MIGKPHHVIKTLLVISRRANLRVEEEADDGPLGVVADRGIG